MKEQLREQAIALGFNTVGFCSAEPPTTIDALIQWTDKGYHGNMEYMVRHLALRKKCGDCPTDSDGNGDTEAFDLAILLGAWGPVTPDSACLDADENGLVEAFDLAVLLGAWGPCP